LSQARAAIALEFDVSPADITPLGSREDKTLGTLWIFGFMLGTPVQVNIAADGSTESREFAVG